MKKSCAVLVSGGVDSSVALRLLQEMGYNPTAYYLKIWLEDELAYLGSCPWQEDLEYVEKVCEQAGVALEIISLQKEYWDRVVTFCLQEIKAGRTPNPDILCNQRIKFGAFLDAIGTTFELVATGHYARIIKKDGLAELHVTNDLVKDQTYFLSHLSQSQLSRILFPIGHLTKAEVRQEAQRFNLPNKDRKDSQGICFLGKLKFSDFISHHFGEQEGDLIEVETEKTVGKHRGYWFYTIGQRQGLGLSGGPWYVVAKDSKTNTVFISRQYYTEDKVRDTFVMRDCVWNGQIPKAGTYSMKMRHGPQYTVGNLGIGSEGTFNVKLAHRDQGLAEGQYAVIYNNTRCLGGGIISL